MVAMEEDWPVIMVYFTGNCFKSGKSTVWIFVGFARSPVQYTDYTRGKGSLWFRVTQERDTWKQPPGGWADQHGDKGDNSRKKSRKT